MKNRLKIALISVCVIAALAVATLSSLALFTDRLVGDAPGKAGEVNAVLHETFYKEDQTGAELDTPNEDGTDTDRKTFWVESTGNKRCYVRAKLITTFDYFDEGDGTWKPAAIPQNCMSYTVNAADWIESGDYFYYAKILNPGDLTTKVYVLDVRLTQSLPSFYQDKKLRYRMDVIMESAQATHEAYKGIFGIDDLPAGVEKL